MCGLNEVRYSVVVPVYNEEEVIEGSYRRLKEVMDNSTDLMSDIRKRWQP